MVTKQDSEAGIGFMGLLALVFIVLKLTGYITWSWWLVLAPLWVPLVIAALIIITIVIIAHRNGKL